MLTPPFQKSCSSCLTCPTVLSAALPRALFTSTRNSQQDADRQTTQVASLKPRKRKLDSSSKTTREIAGEQTIPWPSEATWPCSTSLCRRRKVVEVCQAERKLAWLESEQQLKAISWKLTVKLLKATWIVSTRVEPLTEKASPATGCGSHLRTKRIRLTPISG